MDDLLIRERDDDQQSYNGNRDREYVPKGNRPGGSQDVIFYDLALCPRCDGKNTTLKNSFGPTLCRAIYYCEDCQEPFEQFKAL